MTCRLTSQTDSERRGKKRNVGKPFDDGLVEPGKARNLRVRAITWCWYSPRAFLISLGRACGFPARLDRAGRGENLRATLRLVSQWQCATGAKLNVLKQKNAE